MSGKSLECVLAQPTMRAGSAFADASAQRVWVALTLLPSEMQMSRGESLPDTGEVLSRYLDVLAIRTLSHTELEAWADAASIPVINALTADEHPCQALADALTIRERLGGPDGLRLR